MVICDVSSQTGKLIAPFGMIRRARCHRGPASDQYASCNLRPSHTRSPPQPRSARSASSMATSAPVPLRAEGSRQGRHPWRAADARRRPRRGVADPVGADPDHLAQIRALILRADNRGEGGIVALLALLSARNARPGTWRAQLLIVGLDRRRAALWRRRHHAGDLGAERHRRPEGRCAVAGAGRGADHRRHPDRPVRHAEKGHRLHRPDLRPGHARLVRGSRSCSASTASSRRRRCSPR